MPDWQPWREVSSYSLSWRKGDRWRPNGAAHSTSLEACLVWWQFTWYLVCLDRGALTASISDWQPHADFYLWAFKENVLRKKLPLQGIQFSKLYIGGDYLEKNPILRKCWLDRQPLLSFNAEVLWILYLHCSSPPDSHLSSSWFNHWSSSFSPYSLLLRW